MDDVTVRQCALQEWQLMCRTNLMTEVTIVLHDRRSDDCFT